MENEIVKSVPNLPKKQTLDAYEKTVNLKPNSPPQTYQGVQYYEIGFIEAQLDRVFAGLWNTEIINTQIIGNSIVISLKLIYYNPAAQCWQFKSGIGAAPIITNKGASPTDFTQIQTYSVQKAAPAAKSFALKNAAQQIGNAFGRHLNRNFNLDYTPNTNLDKFFNDED